MKTVILAGGKSSRMGQNKALLPIEGKSVIERLVDGFTPTSDEIIIVANYPNLYRELKATVISDVKDFAGDGPLAGIYTGLEAANSAFCLFVACDMPFASPIIGEYLVEELLKENYDVVIPSYDGKIHPLFGAYQKRIQPVLKDKLLKGKRKVLHLLDEVNVKIVEKQEIPLELQDEWEFCLWNMNTMEDYQKALELYKKYE